jgi:hypothetical protein
LKFGIGVDKKCIDNQQTLVDAFCHKKKVKYFWQKHKKKYLVTIKE